MIFINRNELQKEYQELLMNSKKDAEIISKIENFKEYIKNRHGLEIFTKLFNSQKGSFLALVLQQYNYDRNFYVEKLKNTTDTEREKLIELINAYDLLIEEMKALTIEEHDMIIRQAKRKKLEKILTSKEIELIKTEYLVSLNANNLTR